MVELAADRLRAPNWRGAAWALAAQRLGLVLLFALGVAVIWLPQRPPMLDFPQHAGQIALLRDLILGRSPWAHDVRLNLLTPYLIGYALVLPLSFVMPVVAALKLVLTAAYAAFGLIGIGIRRELRAARELDAYYFVSFFGSAYSWGFCPFLIAAPVGLGFIWLAIRYSREPRVTRGFALSALGVALLFSQGLVYAFASALGLMVVWVKAKGPRDAIVRSWPFAGPALLCMAVFIIMRYSDATAFPSQVLMPSLADRAKDLLGETFDPPSPVPVLGTLALAVLPWLGGLKLDLRRSESLAIGVGAIAVLAVAPYSVWSISVLHPRFVLYLAPAYAWLFSPGRAPPTPRAALFAPLLSMAAIGVGGVELARHAVHAVMFSREARDFEPVLARAKPDQRALSLVYDRGSEVNANGNLYYDFPLYYQVEKTGFVDFNFAYYQNQLIRFTLPLPVRYADQSLLHQPEQFVWRDDDALRYRYIFVRHTKPIPKTLFASVSCPPVRVAASGTWALYDARRCAAATTSITSPRRKSWGRSSPSTYR